MNDTEADAQPLAATLRSVGLDQLEQWSVQQDWSDGADAPTVEDAHHRVHRLGRVLAAGGQGTVYHTEIPEAAVKLLKRHSEAPTETIGTVSRLPISDLPVAMPFSTIQEPPGYVMTMVRDMVPIAQLRRPSVRNGQPLLTWFSETGGVRRRLAAAARVAEILSELHARGIVYGDLNPNNVLVSDTSTGHVGVYLIDTDNMRYANDGSFTPYTPGYAAPEHYEYPHEATFESDAFSLAVVTFETITGLRPFLDGAEVQRERPGGPAELDAMSGNLPSVIDDDESNHAQYWLMAREHLLTDELLLLFQLAFGVGRQDPLVRPTAAQLSRRLWTAHGLAVDCENCGLWHLAAGTTCAVCGERVRPLELTLSLESDPTPLTRLHLGKEMRHLEVRKPAIPPTARAALHRRAEPLAECRVQDGVARLHPFEGVRTPKSIARGERAQIEIEGSQLHLVLEAR